jgi:CrcB protein
MLIKQGFYGLFALYTLLSILLGFFAVLGGSILGKTF